eukprot:scaffold306_cov525-Prasinococcus_capsulatus_cf.AAC.9
MTPPTAPSPPTPDQKSERAFLRLRRAGGADARRGCFAPSPSRVVVSSSSDSSSFCNTAPSVAALCIRSM